MNENEVIQLNSESEKRFRVQIRIYTNTSRAPGCSRYARTQGEAASSRKPPVLVRNEQLLVVIALRARCENIVRVSVSVRVVKRWSKFIWGGTGGYTPWTTAQGEAPCFRRKGKSEALVVIALSAASSVRRHLATMCQGEVRNFEFTSPNNIQQLWFPKVFS